MRTITPRLRGHANNDSAAPRLRPQLVADGVVASYIHEISVRHRAGDPARRRPERRLPRTYFSSSTSAECPIAA